MTANEDTSSKQFVIVVHIYAAMNLLWLRMTFQSCAVICVILLANVNST